MTRGEHSNPMASAAAEPAGMPRLRDLSPLARLGLTCLLLVIAGGFAASIRYVFTHHGKRDDRPGLTVTDLQGVYHGVSTPSRLGEALRRNHPPELPAAERDALLAWLALPPERLSAAFDDLDAGENAPSEIIARACVSCHARQAADPVASRIPLDYWDDVQKLAVSREISPNSVDILVVSTHTHALSLGTLTVVLALLLLATRCPRWLAGVLIAALGASLLADLGSWWLARRHDVFAYVIAGAGGVYSAAGVLTLLVVLLDLWLPRRGPRAT